MTRAVTGHRKVALITVRPRVLTVMALRLNRRRVTTGAMHRPPDITVIESSPRRFALELWGSGWIGFPPSNLYNFLSGQCQEL